MDLLIFALGIFLLIVGIKKFKEKYSTRLEPVKDKANFKPIALIVDTETTGLIIDNSLRVTKNNISEYPDNFPRIVQICYILIDEKGNYDGDKFYIKQDAKIPKKAIRIHGITDEKCEKEGVELKKALNEFSIAASKVDNIVGHNIKFDFKVLQAEFLRAEIPFPLRQKNKIDTMKLAAKHLGYNYGYKISLYNAAERIFGKSKWNSIKSNFKQHDAESDAFVTALIFNTLYKSK